MRAIVGLGNPGSEYAGTRHNAGYRLADLLVERWAFPAYRRGSRARGTKGVVGEIPVRVLKPLTYMNRSGAALRPLLEEPDFDPSCDLLVLVDDVALRVGRFRIRPQGSSGGQGGLQSIQAAIQHDRFARVRIGVGPAPPDQPLAQFVLSPFDADAERHLADTLLGAAAAVETWVQEGVDIAMNRHNRRGEP